MAGIAHDDFIHWWESGVRGARLPENDLPPGALGRAEVAIARALAGNSPWGAADFRC
jgi:hypothetical protein